ncbi:prophage protein [Salmonella enterica subsp. enterica]|uniref:Prophage protein n=1 Tax=Salmonella enterica I TaxID=59201 RepID=A0A379VHF3_SALET|nr:prophage protein [Salmonella enterica subsp. enterica]
MNTVISLIPASAPDAPPALTPYAQRTIRRAVNLLDKHLRQPGVIFTSAASVRDWLRLQLSPLEREVFMVLFLNNQHQLLAHETLFTGGVSHTEVHPREVLRAAMRHNAAAVVLAHNHPSGDAEPSQADRLITTRLVNTLELVDIRVLDHFIVGHRISCPLPNGAGCENHQQAPGDDALLIPLLKENHNAPKPTLRACLGPAERYHALVWRSVSAGRLSPAFSARPRQPSR